MMESKTLNLTINHDPKTVYDFVANLKNLSQWATAFCLAIKKVDGEWVADTPQGPIRIRIAAKNSQGILDHYVIPAPGVEVFVPMRVVPNGRGSEVLFTLFRRPEMTDEQYAQDQKWVVQDLKTLKSILEAKQ